MLQDGARPSQNDASAVQLFFLLQGAVSIAPLLLTYYLDRYLVPIALLLGLAFATLPRTGHRGVSRPPLLLGLGALAAMIIFSVTATHDYFALHQARWRLLERCMAERHIDPSQIEGGFEFDNWFAPGSFDKRTAAKHGDYVVAKSPANRLGLVDQEQFGLWLPPKKEVMFLIRKQP
jgi:hypothetical protein